MHFCTRLALALRCHHPKMAPAHPDETVYEDNPVRSQRLDWTMKQNENLRVYVSSPDLQKSLYWRTLWTVVFAQLFGGAGVAVGVTLGALLIRDMTGSESVAGLSAVLYTAGSAAAAFLIGRLTHRFGRRTGLAAGFLAGGIGALGIVSAAVLQQLWLLFVFFVIFGSGMAANLQARYAGTDLARPSQRATAVSFSMVSTTFGAVAGPNLVSFLSEASPSFGLPPLAGPFLLAAAAYFLSGLIFLLFLRPDPYNVAKAVSAAAAADAAKAPEGALAPAGATPGVSRQINRKGVAVGASVILMAQFVMTAIMTMTPVHMQNHGHGLDEVGFVIGMHIACMYLPSLFTGVLTDKLGRTAIAYASGAVLLASGLLAAMAPADSALLLTVALGLLGLGWNLGFLSGTSMIVDATTPAVRAKTQGTVDVLVALAGASGGMLSGIITSHAGYPSLAMLSGLMALLVAPILLWSRHPRKSSAEDRGLTV